MRASLVRVSGLAGVCSPKRFQVPHRQQRPERRFQRGPVLQAVVNVFVHESPL
jgi:hypothetical protein